MCGRYSVNEKTDEDIRRIVDHIEYTIKTEKGDVHPSEAAAVITGGQGNDLCARTMYWGFPSYQSSHLLINARSETVLERKMFADSVRKRRCAIPASHFYEWDQEKNKVTFTRQDGRPLYLAGFYNRYNGEEHFIILTTAANASMRPVHDRMPLILAEKEIFPWISGKLPIGQITRSEQAALKREQEYEQLSLF